MLSCQFGVFISGINRKLSPKYWYPKIVLMWRVWKDRQYSISEGKFPLLSRISILISNILYILTDRSYPLGNSMVISICPPLRLNPDQMQLNFTACKAKSVC